MANLLILTTTTTIDVTSSTVRPIEMSTDGFLIGEGANEVGLVDE